KISFKENDISLTQFVSTFYEEKRIDLLANLFEYLEPESYYLGYHGYWGGENINPLFYFYKTYNHESDKWEEDPEHINHHLRIDVNLLKKHSDKISALQSELNQVLNGIRAAQELNKSFTSVYSDITDMDIQTIWKHHDKLYCDSSEELVVESLAHDIAIENLNFETDNKDSLKFSNSEDEASLINTNNLLKLIKEKEKSYNIKGMPPFDLNKYNQINKLMDSPHFDTRNQEYLIAKFAGSSTSLLNERLNEVNLQFGNPIRNPQTGIWNYTIDYTTNFLGLIYRHLIDYVNLMMDGLGYIPTCSWCGKPINPTGQQLRRLKENLNIYCLEKNQPSFNSCRKQGTAFKQNRKRNKKKKIVKQSNTIESLNDRKLKKHFSGKSLLTFEEQSELIQQSVKHDLSKKFK
ncbi:hypothetical protein, partial [Bacillus cereus group sp. BfR-BA-01454]